MKCQALCFNERIGLFNTDNVFDEGTNYLHVNVYIYWILNLNSVQLYMHISRLSFKTRVL